MAAVAIARPKKKARSDQVEPLNDDESEVSGPSTSQKTSRPGSAWSAKDEDVINNFAASDDNNAKDMVPFSANVDANDNVAEQERTSINGSRGMLQKMKKNAVVPVDEEPSGSESGATRINVKGKRDVPEAWDNYGHDADVDSSLSSSRPGSAPLYRLQKAAFRPTSAPQSKLAQESKTIGKEGPYERDTDSITESASPTERPSTSKSIGNRSSGQQEMAKRESMVSRPGSQGMSRAESRGGSREGHLSTKTDSSESMLAPPVASGDTQAYIPFDYAKECIARVVDNMKRMKGNHVKVVEKIQDQYKAIEEHTQGQFNDYVIKLRMEYSEKVGTFKKIIEIHQTELERSQDYWQNSVKSLKEKNKLLLEDRRKYLTKTREELDSMEEEKVRVVKHLTQLLDQKHQDYLAVMNRLNEEEGKRKELEEELKREAEKEQELQQKQVQLSDDTKKVSEEKERLEKELEEKSSAFVMLQDEKSKTEMTLKEAEDENSKLKDEISKLQEIVAELEGKVKELESRPVAAVGVVTTEPLVKKEEEEHTGAAAAQSQDDSIVATATTVSTTGLVVAGISTEESERLEKTIKELENDLAEKGKSIQKLEKDNADLNERVLQLRSETGNSDIAILELQRENQNLRERLKVAVSQMADSIDTSDVEQRMEAAKEEKSELDKETSDFKVQLEKWKEEFRETHDGREPTEEDRTEEIEGLIQEIKSNDEKLQTMNADVAVMKLLLGAPVEETTQDQDASVANDELIKKLVEEKNSLLDKFEILRKEKEEIREEADEAKQKNDELQEKIESLENTKETLENDKESLENDKEILEARIEELSSGTSETSPATVVVSGSSLEVESAADESLRAEVEELNKSLATNKEEYDAKIEELNVKLGETEASIEVLTKERDDSVIRVQELEGKISNDEENFNGQLDLKQKEIEQLKAKIDELESARLSNLPVDVADEIKALQEQLKTLEEEKEASSKEVLDSKASLAALNLNIEKLNKQLEKEQERNQQLHTEKKSAKDESEKKLKALEAKLAAAATTTAATRKESRPSKENTAATKALQKKVDTLEKQLAAAKEKAAQAAAAPPVEKPKEPKGPSLNEQKLTKENEKLNEKVEAFKKASKEDREKVKTLQNEIKDLKEKISKAGPSTEEKMAAKKQEKQMKELQKTIETEKKRTEKLKGDLSKAEEDLANLKKELAESNSEVKKKDDELAKLGVAAKQGAEAMAKVEELEVTCKTLTEDNKTLTENYNSERILRKKYYNMVEDMKGKIRVYARARPLSKSELDRGNFTVIKSPDEYTLVVDAQRGPKEFQYDQVFMPDSSQEKVFEDTSMLIQSAVDGYNVCIFAYGQTGSGKTFTVIGDKEQKFPGIAPRAFKNLFALIEENKKKFSFKVELYMMELYMDKLIDLFGTNKDAKLDIKKDKKGMVVVQGAVIHEAHDADELMSLFEKGSSTRHVSSTKMNAESSRSHLIISIIIEATNVTSGAVTKGKLSLVDLAGSERAAKTGASPEQLKEAQSINKSLSALGDVISSLSSEQSFIPYRNNKLTMLMQDSLGGNAKTLMFVNISPADYNCDETITSLTYASRVKLITNDASKNAESKEVARLKGIIAKLKKGETIDEEEQAD